MEIGKKLRETRENRGLTLEAVEEETKIRRKYLHAMEEEKFHILPGPVYARAFLKNYARFLNLNVEEIMELYKQRFEAIPEKADEPSEKPAEKRTRDREPAKPRYWLYLAAAAVIVSIVAALYYGTAGFDQKRTVDYAGEEAGKRETAPPSLQTDEPLQTPGGQQQTAGQEPAGQAAGVDLVLNIKDSRSWIAVDVDGVNAFEGELSAGQSKAFQAKERISVTLGNAGVVEVIYNGRNLGFLGGVGSVVSREFKAQPQG